MSKYSLLAPLNKFLMRYNIHFLDHYLDTKEQKIFDKGTERIKNWNSIPPDSAESGGEFFKKRLMSK
ncbi:MAG: hypothetical protein V3U72_02665, partial [Candidatus Aenigmarchaeota archaeon]